MKKIEGPFCLFGLCGAFLLSFLLSFFLSFLPMSVTEISPEQIIKILSKSMLTFTGTFGDEGLSLTLTAVSPIEAPKTSNVSVSSREFSEPKVHMPISRLVIFPAEDDSEWEVPDLVLRKHIWEHFAVTLIPLGKDSTGAERHSVQWHRERLRMGYLGGAFEDYAETHRRRLMQALEASTKWDVLPAETLGLVTIFPETEQAEEITMEHEICILRMTFLPPVTEEAPKAETPKAETPKAESWVEAPSKPSTKPTMRCLNDIKRFFHVVWDNKTTGNPKIYIIKIHNKNTMNAGLDVKQHGADLLAALKLSNEWRVLRPANNTEICRIEMA